MHMVATCAAIDDRPSAVRYIRAAMASAVELPPARLGFCRSAVAGSCVEGQPHRADQPRHAT